MAVPPVTIRDVAKAAGVSVATVSRALNNRSNVAPEIRTHVVAIARELNYVPHAGASSLSSRRTNMIGVVLPALHGEFISEFIRGVDTVTRERGFHLLISSYHESFEDQSAVVRNILSRVDGVILMSPFDEPAVAYRELADLSKPVVLINAQVPVVGMVQISVDNFGGSVAMMEHLQSEGYRNIAFAAGPANNSEANERLRGYREFMAMHFPHAQLQVFDGDFSEASGFRVGNEILSLNEKLPQDQRIDAVFCVCDMMALGVNRALASEGAHGIGISGFDDIPMAEHMFGGLTSMATDIFGVGKRACEVICHIIREGERLVPDVTISPRLIPRQSTSKASKAAP